MKIRPLLLLLCCLVLVIAGCGAGSPSASPTVTGTAPVSTSSEPTPTDSPTASFTVAASITCDELFNGAKPTTTDQLIALLTKSTITDRDIRTAKTLRKQLDDLYASAKPALQPLIGAERAAVIDLETAAQSGRGTVTRDLQNFRLAGLQLLKQCTPYIH